MTSPAILSENAPRPATLNIRCDTLHNRQLPQHSGLTMLPILTDLPELLATLRSDSSAVLAVPRGAGTTTPGACRHPGLARVRENGGVTLPVILLATPGDRRPSTFAATPSTTVNFLNIRA